MDILTRCTGSVAAEVVKCTAKPVIRHVGYLFRFKKTVDDLTKAKTDLQLEQQKVQEAIERAAMNTEVVEKDVERWLANVNQLLEEVQALENKVQVNLRFCNGWCPDWIRQYRFCKEAIQKTNVVKELQVDKGKFSELTHRAPTPGIEIFSSSDFEVFESRKLAFQQIMEALHDDNNKRIGLHGIGGIGKTTLVKEVYKKVKELNIFKDILMIVVSQTPEVRRIQGEIADCLQLKLEEESDTARAKRICLRIKNVEKILIILDDVWKDVNLEAIGIPSCDDHRDCKMLLTTRSVHVCNLMRCQRKIPLNFLVEEESLALMKKIAIVDDCAVLNDVVLKVVKECKGLPIAIITVGKALIGKSLDDWNAAMHQLRKSRLVDIEGVDEEKNAYACLKWSYDQLKCKTKLCFLLCSLLPEDYNIPIEELTRYAMGLEEDEDFQSLDEARSQVHAAINSLKDSSLLLEGSKKEFVKMHDMVRDVGLWITSKGKNEFELRACTRLERNTNLERATAISLIDYNTEQLPDNLVCPRLNILLLGRIRSSKEISNALFEGMNCLKVLTLHGKILSSQSLELLTNLRTLYLEGCNFSDDLSSLGKLKRLETLSFNGCRMVALPSELGEMASLKMLDLTNCYRLKWIPPNVIQSLSKLEELIIERSFNNWDVEGPTSKKSNGSFKNWNVGRITSKKSNAKLSELNFLPRLVILSIELNSEHLPKGFVFPDLQRYCISIDGQQLNPFSIEERGLGLFFQERNTNFRFINSSILEIKNWDASSINAFKLLFHTVKYLRIQRCDTKCIVDTTGGNDQYVSFSNLVELRLWKMRRLRKICEGPNQYVSFSNLTVLVAHGCPRLISLFSPSLAQSLKKLKRLSLDRCDEMKQIISEEGMILESHRQPICLSKLETLVVEKCGKLEYIFPISIARGLQQLERLNLRDLPRLKKVFGQEREGEVGDCEIESHHQPTGFPKLTTIEVVNCENLECLSIARDLPQLESLSLQDLPQLKQVFGQNREGEVGDGNNNVQLESHHQRTGFPKLKTIEVVNCENLECLSIARDLPQLEKLSLEDLPQLKQVFGHEKGGDDGDGNNSVLSKLRNLRLWNLPEFVSFGGGNSSSVWPSLESLYMVNCPKVKLSFFANVEANVPALQKLQNLQILSLHDWNGISFDWTQGLSNLEELEIKNCGGIQEVIKLEGLLTRKGEQQDLLLPRLNKMLLIDLHELWCIWKGATKPINLNNLEDLKVIGCKKLTHLFTPALAQRLQKLKFLEIARCDELEHLIVENVEERVSSECHLQPLCFPKLERVNVGYCNKLKSLFPMTIADSLLELQVFLVKKNPQLMEVFTHEGDAGVQKDVTLPQLKLMGLKGLPSLVDFCPKNYQFILPK
ncbi:disease resistance protein At4g27190-like [Quercus suber]|uniref:disease resistance protein At4g27190-like n=1 Tax=Quercus suber TaxID=58331 RepID=UPI0032DF01FB